MKSSVALLRWLVHSHHWVVDRSLSLPAALKIVSSDMEKFLPYRFIRRSPIFLRRIGLGSLSGTPLGYSACSCAETASRFGRLRGFHVCLATPVLPVLPDGGESGQSCF